MKLLDLEGSFQEKEYKISSRSWKGPMQVKGLKAYASLDLVNMSLAEYRREGGDQRGADIVGDGHCDEC